jgi:hypothetical protein
MTSEGGTATPATPELPQPDPALRRLDRLVGRWSMESNLVGSDEKNIRGETTFRWLPGGFFLEQHVQLCTQAAEQPTTRPRSSAYSVSRRSSPAVPESR